MLLYLNVRKNHFPRGQLRVTGLLTKNSTGCWTIITKKEGGIGEADLRRKNLKSWDWNFEQIRPIYMFVLCAKYHKP